LIKKSNQINYQIEYYKKKIKW